MREIVYSTLLKYAEDQDKVLYDATRENAVDYAVTYGKFMYHAGTWDHPRTLTANFQLIDYSRDSLPILVDNFSVKQHFYIGASDISGN